MRNVLDIARGAPGMTTLAMLAGMLLLCWPAFVNGGAFFFPDTSAYLRGADAILFELTGWRSEWSDKLHLYDESIRHAAPEDAGQAQGASTGAAEDSEALHPVLLGRSIYYGMMIFPFVALFGSLGGALLQAAFGMFVIRIVLIAMGTDRSRLAAYLLLTAALLAGLTSLPFFVSLLMPDVFAGFAIALAVSAAVGWRRLSTPDRIALAIVLCLSAMAHSSHVLVLLILFGIALLARMAVREIPTAGLAIILLAAMCGIAGERLFIAAVTERLGQPPIRPPFLTARLIDEGPGFDLLNDRCPKIGLEACRFLDRMPRDSDTFLWSLDQTKGVFSAESHAVQRRLAEQDLALALATLRHDPLRVIRVSAEAGARQIFLTDLNIFNAPVKISGGGGAFTANLPPAYAEEVRASRYSSGSMPVAFPEWANLLSAIAATIFLTVTVFRQGRGGGKTNQRVALAAGLFLAAIAANAAVTGALSKPHDRYNVRVMWVLPLAALALLITRHELKLREQDDADT